MSLYRITAAQKVGQMLGETSAPYWVCHVSVSLFFLFITTLLPVIIYLADVERGHLNRQN